MKSNIKKNEKSRMKSQTKNISIKKRTIIVFVFSLILINFCVGYMLFTNWTSSVHITMKVISEDMNKKVNEQIKSMLEVPIHINESNQKLIGSGMIDISKEEEREKFFTGVLETYKDEIYSFTYGLETGEYYGARVNEAGKIEIVKNNKETQGQSWYYTVNQNHRAGTLVFKTDLFDPRTRDWYKVAKEGGIQTFSSIYKHFVMNDLTISSAWPIYDNGKLQGVLGSHMILSRIDNFLRETLRGKDGYALIFEKSTGYLIANSLGRANFNTLEDGSIRRYTMKELDIASLQEAYREYETNKDNKFVLGNKGNDSYINIAEYQKEGIDWIVMTSVSNHSLMAEIYHNIKLTVVILLFAVLLASLVFYHMISRLYKPMGKLVEAAERISSGDLTQRIEIVRDDEIGTVAKAFNKMAENMNEFVNNLEMKVKERTIELEKTNEALNKTKENLYLILDSTAEGIFGIDTQGNFTFCNNSGLQMLGYENQGELLGENIHRKIHHSNRDGEEMPVEGCSILKSIHEGDKIIEAKEIFWRKDGSFFDAEYHSYPQCKNGEIIGAVVTFLDITMKKKDEEKIKYLSSHDFLTGLINRRSFETELIEMDTKENLPISILYADLNGLKLVNDIFGHSWGDMLIKKSSKVLTKICRSRDVAARVGGDEFIMILPNTDAKEAKNIMQEVKKRLEKETVNLVKCSMALGFDTKTETDQEIEKILVNAESEMYNEKLQSKKLFGEDTISTIMSVLHQKYEIERIHSEKVAFWCEKMGEALGLSEANIKKLRDVGYLHDIGKIVLSEEILKKKVLNEKEIQDIHQHPVVGYRILKLFDETMDLANGIYSHHENWDGSGYPQGLQGEEIPLIARIIALVEDYEEFQRNDLEYKTEKDIISKIRDNAGKRYDPALSEEFIKMIEKKV